MKNKETIGIIGYGHLGQKLSQGYLKASYEVHINNGDKKRTKQKLKEVGEKISRASTVEEIAHQCSTIILCVKHAQLAVVGSELNCQLNEDHLVISCLAQATLAEVQSFLDHSGTSVVKLMTTLGVGNRKGVSSYQLANTEALLLRGRVEKLVKAVSAKNSVLKLESEEEMKLFTKLVGCLPGIMAYFLHQLELSADMHGGQSFRQYSHMLSTLLRSSADLLEAAGSAQELENQVATPGGYTSLTIKSL